jgi:hypothetical protein
VVHRSWSSAARLTEKTMVVIGDRAYVTREEAERQVKVVCKAD